VDEDRGAERGGDLGIPLVRLRENRQCQLQRLLERQFGQRDILGVRHASLSPGQQALLDFDLRGELHPQRHQLPLLPAVPRQPPGELQGNR